MSVIIKYINDETKILNKYKYNDNLSNQKWNTKLYRSYTLVTYNLRKHYCKNIYENWLLKWKFYANLGYFYPNESYQFDNRN